MPRRCTCISDWPPRRHPSCRSIPSSQDILHRIPRAACGGHCDPHHECVRRLASPLSLQVVRVRWEADDGVCPDYFGVQGTIHRCMLGRVGTGDAATVRRIIVKEADVRIAKVLRLRWSGGISTIARQEKLLQRLCDAVVELQAGKVCLEYYSRQSIDVRERWRITAGMAVFGL